MADPNNSLSRRRLLGFAPAAFATSTFLPSLARANVDAVSLSRAINTIELTRSLQTTATVELHRKGAQTRQRSLETATMRQGSSDLSLRRYAFLSPADISGTKLLVHEKDRKANDLWLLLPSVGKPRRLSASKQSNPFAGTDFSYADLMAIKVDNFTHEIKSSDAKRVILQSQAKSSAVAKELGYAVSVVTADARSFVPSRVDYYDQKGQHFKTQEISGAMQTPDNRFVLRNRSMTVLRNGNKTTIQLGNVNLNPGLGSIDFKSQRL